MSIQLDHGSRFQFTSTTQLTRINGDRVETFSVWKEPSFIRTRPNEDLIGKYQVTSGNAGRPDSIAGEIYGSTLFDWILISFNKSLDVLNWPQAGAVIEYPLPSLVFAEME